MRGVNYYLVLIGLVLSSCVGEQKGIFGSLPALYEQGASRQRDLEDLLASGDADDAEAAAAMNDFMNTYTSLEQNIRREGKRLVGQPVKVLTSPASGLKAGAGVISAVTPGAVTIVEIRIPVIKPLMAIKLTSASLTTTMSWWLKHPPGMMPLPKPCVWMWCLP